MAEFVTAEAARERFRALADQVDAAYDEMRALSSAEVGNEFRTELAERLETQERTRLHPLPIPYTAAYGVARTVATNTPILAFEYGSYSVPHP